LPIRYYSNQFSTTNTGVCEYVWYCRDIHERWRTDDWTWSFSTGLPFTFGTTTDGTIVTAEPKQYATFLGARYIYKFQ
jgi:hypothetical protein